MKKLLLTTALLLAAAPAFAKEYTIKEISDEEGGYFSPDKLTIQPGDVVHFENAQNDKHDVMFVDVPKAVDEMIMSPMQTKKGEVFTYTFTIPGTYQFHCHPHERAGMKGTLIVGQASKPGETKAMDHHKMAKNVESGVSPAATTSSPLPQGTGKVVSVDADKHTIKLAHDPLKALNWPKMTMLFTAESSVNLSGYQAGDSVAFTLKPAGNDDYAIVSIQKAQ